MLSLEPTKGEKALFTFITLLLGFLPLWSMLGLAIGATKIDPLAWFLLFILQAIMVRPAYRMLGRIWGFYTDP